MRLARWATLVIDDQLPALSLAEYLSETAPEPEYAYLRQWYDEQGRVRGWEESRDEVQTWARVTLG